MRYNNECGEKALGLYANHEHVVVAKEMLTEIISQIIEDGTKDGLVLDEVDDHVVAGLMLLFMDVAEGYGYHRLLKNLQDLSVDYGLSSLQS